MTQQPQTILNGLTGTADSLHAIGKVMDFISGATFAMTTHGELEPHGEGLHYLIQYLSALHKQAALDSESEIRAANDNAEKLAQLEQAQQHYVS